MLLFIYTYRHKTILTIASEQVTSKNYFLKKCLGFSQYRGYSWKRR